MSPLNEHPAATAADSVAELERWLAGGGSAVIERRTADRLEVGLYTCTGDERMSGLVFTDHADVACVQAILQSN